MQSQGQGKQNKNQRPTAVVVANCSRGYVKKTNDFKLRYKKKAIHDLYVKRKFQMHCSMVS